MSEAGSMSKEEPELAQIRLSGSAPLFYSNYFWPSNVFFQEFSGKN